MLLPASVLFASIITLLCCSADSHENGECSINPCGEQINVRAEAPRLIANRRQTLAIASASLIAMHAGSAHADADGAPVLLTAAVMVYPCV